jgi:DNA polymerase-3 subunit epsilon
MKTLYLDVETTGLDPKVNDIIQIVGIVEIDGEVKETFKFNCQPFDYSTVEQGALDVNELTIDQIKNFPMPQVVYKQIITIAGKYVNKYDNTDKFTLAGQRVGFDADFLNEFFLKNDDKYYGSWFNWRHIDLLALTRLLNYAGIINTKNDKLETVAGLFDIKLNAHDALEDILATRAVLKKMIDEFLCDPRKAYLCCNFKHNGG